MRLCRICSAFAAAGLAAMAAAAPPGATAAKPTATPLDPSKLGTSVFPARIRDSVDPGRARHGKGALHNALKGNGGVFYADDGTPVHVYTSPRYQYDPSVNQSYADFLGSLYHGHELTRLRAYIAPYGEVKKLCGSESDACYSDEDNQLVTMGDDPPDGTSLEDLAAHEYGHHVANHRLNQTGRAPDYGPTYWATYENVCINDGHSMFPGNEGAHYRQNPGEGWAETFRALNGTISPWNTVGRIFYPTRRSLALAKRDVLNPYNGGEYIDRHGRLSRAHRWRRFRVPVENDGRVKLRLRAKGSLNGDVYVFAHRHSRKPLAHTRRSRLTGIYCAYRHLYLGVRRAGGRGSFRLRATLPFFSTA